MTAHLPPCFRLHKRWADDVRLETVRDAIAWSQSSIRIYGREVPQPRLTAWFGDAAYTYSGRRHEPAPLPPVIATLRSQVHCQTGACFNSVLGNLYRDGSDSVAWHADDEPELDPEPVIASLSFGAARRFAIRHATSGERWEIVLEHGDLLVMSGRSQADYLHSVPKTRKPVGERVNLTFRLVGAP